MRVFFWRWRQVVWFFAIFAFFTYVTITGQWNFYKPWIDATLIGLSAATFLLIWLD
jgi:hypothetical protein